MRGSNGFSLKNPGKLRYGRCTQAVMLQLFSDAVKDLRFGARVLRRSPVFTVVAVASLALGIGGSAAVFSLINAIVLRALPIAEPHRLFLVERRQRRRPLHHL